MQARGVRLCPVNFVTQAEFRDTCRRGRGPAQHAAHPPKRRRSESQQASTLPCTRSLAGLMLLVPSCTTCMCSWSVPCEFRDTQAEFRDTLGLLVLLA